MKELDSASTDGWTLVGPAGVENALSGSGRELTPTKDDIITIKITDAKKFHLEDLRFNVAYAKSVTVDVTVRTKNGDLKVISVVVRIFRDLGSLLSTLPYLYVGPWCGRRA
jgi:hypothetical protein